MIYLDTHIVTALRQNELDALGRKARRAIDKEDDLRVSPIVLLELEYLHEIKRIRTAPQVMLDGLAATIGLRVCARAFLDVVQQAAKETWTRDPFDRMIVAQARLHQAPLITRDGLMLANYSHALA
ncbi:MAG: PIN domain-containing protein [Acidobacteriota bacterium]